MTPSAPLTPELLEALYHACKRNAGALIEAANVLLAEFPAPAFALASTAREELAKAQMAADVHAGVMAEETFHKEFFKHSSKHAYLARRVAWSEGDPAAATESHDRREGGEHSERRNQALFVGLVGSNIDEPRNIISRGEAQELIRDTREWSSAMNYAEALTGSASSKAAAAMAEKRLPEDWREAIAECDFALACEHIRGFFALDARLAASEGMYAAYPSELVDGWEAFASQPSYQTAVRFIEGAREGGPAFYRCFQRCSPGGRTVRDARTLEAFEIETRVNETERELALRYGTASPPAPSRAQLGKRKNAYETG